MLSDVAQGIFKTLYSYNGETIEDTFRRVSSILGNDEHQSLGFHYLVNNVWRPNTPVFFNAGKPKGKQILSACYVVDLQDSMKSIMDIVQVSSRIFQFGSGVGIPIGNLREKDAPIFEKGDEKTKAIKKSIENMLMLRNQNFDTLAEGKSSGPINFMELFDVTGKVTKSGGRARRAAILCLMMIWHPDIEQFITCKEKDGTYSNMNISVGITDKFMECLKENVPYSIHTPYDGSIRGHKNPTEVWRKIAEYAHKTADPGILFIDTINRYNPLKSKILIQSTNPCGEQPLRPWECCNLSAINIAKFVKEDGTFDWDGLFEAAYNVTEIMDNLVDVMDFPDERFEERTKKTRPIGLGIMGLSDAMFMMDIKYNSKEGQIFAGEIMRIVTYAGFTKSAELAKEKGCFPYFKDEEVKRDTIEIIKKHISKNADGILTEPQQELIKMIEEYGVRNCQISTCAPTGTTALSCDCSYGIEPSFGLVFQKNFVDGRKTKIVNEVFRKRFSKEPWYTDDILEKIIANDGSLKNVRGIPREVKDVFVVAHDIKYRDRIDIQAAIQRHCSTAISSTINLPETATVEEIMEIYEYAYEKELKGVTVYRDKCKENQPVTFSDDKKESKKTTRPKRLSGNSYQVELPDGDFLITVNQSGDDVIEIILDQDNEKVEIKCLLEFCGKLASKALRHGMPLEDIIKQGKNLTGDNVKFVKFLDTDAKAVQVKSTPDCLAKLLERFYIHGGLKAQEALGLTTCPQCGNETMTIIEGCPGCVSCGYSKCGS